MPLKTETKELTIFTGVRNSVLRLKNHIWVASASYLTIVLHICYLLLENDTFKIQFYKNFSLNLTCYMVYFITHFWSNKDLWHTTYVHCATCCTYMYMYVSMLKCMYKPTCKGYLQSVYVFNLNVLRLAYCT